MFAAACSAYLGSCPCLLTFGSISGWLNSTVRLFEGVRDKTPDAATYSKIVSELKPVMDELSLDTPEELGLAK